MDVVSYRNNANVDTKSASSYTLFVTILWCWMFVVTGCTIPSAPQENVDIEDTSYDIFEPETSENSVDVVEPDSVTELKTCDPQDILPLACEVLDTWWWEGENNPLWKFNVGTMDTPCKVELEVSHEWLKVTHDIEAGYLSVEVLAHQLSTGRHSGLVNLNPCSEELATTLEIDARIFKKPSQDARAKVLVVGLDGVRPDALALAETPTIDMLTRHAAYSYNAHTQMHEKTKSGPGWASVMTGVDGDKHKVDSNLNDVLENHNELYPSFLERAHVELGSRTVAAAHWAPVLLLTPDEALSEVALGNDNSVALQMSDFLHQGDYDLHFLHLDDPDAAGHSNGFGPGNPLYIEAIENSDTHLKTLIDNVLMRPTIADEDWLFIVTTDHGGGGFDHGAKDAENRTIFLIVSGSSVVPEVIEDGAASHMDVHPTVMQFLGLPLKPSWKLDGEVRGLY